MRLPAVERADAIVVFGAAVRPGGPSLTVRVRCERASRAYGDGLAPLVLCSGGRASGISEAAAMRALLCERGVPGDAIIPDDGGTSTRATLRSVSRMGWRRIVAVSSDYHLARIRAEGRRQGIDVIACPARREDPLRLDTPAGRRRLAFDVRQRVRETLATPAYAVTGRLGAWLERTRAGRLARAAAVHARARVRSFAGEVDAIAAAGEEIAERIRRSPVTSDVACAVSLRDTRLAWPAQARVTSRFGMRHGRLHMGVDLGTAYGAPVRPALEGTVLHAGWLGPYGNVVVIVHGAGLATVYAHLAGIVVAEGDVVDPARPLGYAGTTGRSSGPHLHFEVRLQGAPVDPLIYIGAQADIASSASAIAPSTPARSPRAGGTTYASIDSISGARM